MSRKRNTLEYPYRRRLLQMAVVLLIMMDTLRRMLSNSPLMNTLMGIAELLLLFFVAYEVIQPRLHRKKLDRFTAQLTEWIKSGRHIQKSAPVSAFGQIEYEKVGQWERDIAVWKTGVESFLASHSVKSLSAFDSIPALGGLRGFFGDDGSFTPLTGRLGDTYQLLATRLENLKRIIESADIYL